MDVRYAFPAKDKAPAKGPPAPLSESGQVALELTPTPFMSALAASAHVQQALNRAQVGVLRLPVTYAPSQPAWVRDWLARWVPGLLPGFLQSALVTGLVVCRLDADSRAPGPPTVSLVTRDEAAEHGLVGLLTPSFCPPLAAGVVGHYPPEGGAQNATRVRVRDPPTRELPAAADADTIVLSALLAVLEQREEGERPKRARLASSLPRAEPRTALRPPGFRVFADCFVLAANTRRPGPLLPSPRRPGVALCTAFSPMLSAGHEFLLYQRRRGAEAAACSMAIRPPLLLRHPDPLFQTVANVDQVEQLGVKDALESARGFAESAAALGEVGYTLDDYLERTVHTADALGRRARNIRAASGSSIKARSQRLIQMSAQMTHPDPGLIGEMLGVLPADLGATIPPAQRLVPLPQPVQTQDPAFHHYLPTLAPLATAEAAFDRAVRSIVPWSSAASSHTRAEAEKEQREQENGVRLWTDRLERTLNQAARMALQSLQAQLWDAIRRLARYEDAGDIVEHARRKLPPWAWDDPALLHALLCADLDADTDYLSLRVSAL